VLVKRVILFASMFALAPMVWAGSFQTALGQPGFQCQQLSFPINCSSDPVYLWNQGDYVGQDVTGSGLGSISQLSIDLEYQNLLDPGFTETYGVTVNGTSVGSFSIPGLDDGNYYFQSDLFNFGPISGPYDILFTITSATIPIGDGSIGWVDDGVTSTITLTSATPEPGTMALCAIGLGLPLLLALRRRLTA
jgi:hypothetical protein